jgi:hypothetical protein
MMHVVVVNHVVGAVRRGRCGGLGRWRGAREGMALGCRRGDERENAAQHDRQLCDHATMPACAHDVQVAIGGMETMRMWASLVLCHRGQDRRGT